MAASGLLVCLKSRSRGLTRKEMVGITDSAVSHSTHQSQGSMELAWRVQQMSRDDFYCLATTS